MKLWASITVGIAALSVVGAALYVSSLSESLVKRISPNGSFYDARTHYFQRGPFDKKVVCITFDDGPHPTSAKTLLATLKAEHVPATFFVVGSRVKEHPEIVKEMIDEGHAVGNHTQDHIRLDTLPPDKIAKQIEYCETNVERATGHRMGYLRPPGMRFNDSVLKVSTKLGYTIIGWNIGAKDFIAGKPKKPLDQMTVSEAKTVDLTPELVTSRVLKQLKKGTIILLHDNPVTAAALPAIIRQVRAKGFEFVSVQKMMQALPQPVQVASNPVLVAKTSAKMR